MRKLEESLRGSPVVEKEDYSYFVHPITDGTPPLEPGLLREISARIVNLVDVEDVDKIVAPEAMGIHISTALSIFIDVPVVVVRKRSYGFEDEVGVHQVTGYDDNEMYINGVNEDDSVLLIDDVVSTGGTLNCICDALESIGTEIVDAVAVIQKGTDRNIEVPVDFLSLVTVDVVDGDVVILDED
ncbi:MAG: hypoxanthine/guanine phosphoribosyltransferase [Halobacteria archaeon]